MTTRFVPPYPPRPAQRVPVWRTFFGERARNSVFGWSEAAFELPHIKRRLFGLNIHIPLDPDAVQHVLQTNAANYVKPDVVKRVIARMVGRGLLSADGELWRAQRRIVAASFAPAAVEALAPAFADAARAQAGGWEAGMRDMAAEATATTMTIIADTLFGGDPRLRTREGMAHIAAALKAGGETRIAAVLGLPMFGWNRTMRAGQRGRRFLRTTLRNVVHDRGPDGGGDDFLGQLIRALHERFDAAEAQELALDNAATFYLAGHETTANAITWTLYLLSQQPELQDSVAAEAQVAVSVNEGDLADRVPLLRRVMEEAMRLYPPVPRFDRQAVAADRLGDQDVGPGDIVSIWPWVLHRHRVLWDDPDVFDADRFSPDGRARQHRFQYIPFGGGPRVCVGQRFATIEGLTILTHWLARWRFTPTAGYILQPVGSVTLRPEGGLPLQLSARNP